MNPFHGQMSRSTFPRQYELIKERRLSRVKLGAKATFVPFYLFSPPHPSILSSVTLFSSTVQSVSPSPSPQNISHPSPPLLELSLDSKC